MTSWDFSCGDFHENLSDYASLPATTLDGIATIAPIDEKVVNDLKFSAAPVVEAGPDPFKDNLKAAADTPKSSPLDEAPAPPAERVDETPAASPPGTELGAKVDNEAHPIPADAKATGEDGPPEAPADNKPPLRERDEVVEVVIEDVLLPQDIADDAPLGDPLDDRSP